VKRGTPDKVTPSLTVRIAYRLYFWLFLGGDSEEFAVAYSELVEAYQRVYQRTGSRRQADLSVLGSLYSGSSEETRFVLRWIWKFLFGAAYVLVRVLW
jgi:hypothetical protein